RDCECVAIDQLIDLFARAGARESAITASEMREYRNAILDSISARWQRAPARDFNGIVQIPGLDAIAGGLARIGDDAGREQWLTQLANWRNQLPVSTLDLMPTYVLAASLPSASIRKLAYSGMVSRG